MTNGVVNRNASWESDTSINLLLSVLVHAPCLPFLYRKKRRGDKKKENLMHSSKNQTIHANCSATQQIASTKLTKLFIKLFTLQKIGQKQLQTILLSLCLYVLLLLLLHHVLFLIFKLIIFFCASFFSEHLFTLTSFVHNIISYFANSSC